MNALNPFSTHSDSDTKKLAIFLVDITLGLIKGKSYPEAFLNVRYNYINDNSKNVQKNLLDTGYNFINGKLSKGTGITDNEIKKYYESNRVLRK